MAGTQPLAGLLCRFAPRNDEIMKRKRNAGRRVFQPPHFRVRLALKRSALAYRRSTTALAAANQRHRSASDALPGTRLKTGVTRLRLSQSSDKVADRSSCRPGVSARSRPGARLTRLRPREPHPLRQPESPGQRPSRERDRGRLKRLAALLVNRAMARVHCYAETRMEWALLVARNACASRFRGRKYCRSIIEAAMIRKFYKHLRLPS